MTLPSTLPNDVPATTVLKVKGASHSRTSFLLHLRPKYYPSLSIYCRATWLLGFFSVFFFVLESITGLILMVYYVPTPGEAYSSIGRLITEIPFGWLIRDLHRLGGEAMIVVVTLHLLRVYIAGAYQQQRRMTWVTGIGLWLLTLALAFSGYLLPWDQLAYWAVTIGTSIADTIPFIGQTLTTILRGGSSFGAEGLLRFYLLHIIALPTIFLLLLAIHYYRVIRLHGISFVQGPGSDDRTSCDAKNLERQTFFPQIPLAELFLSLVCLIFLTVVATWFYNAPLQHHADPLHTPGQTKAPWFFLWLQGALKLGDSFVIGICLPLTGLLLFTLFPYFPSNTAKQFNPFYRKIIFVICSMTLIGLTVLGLPRFGVTLNPAAVILLSFMPEESTSRFHAIGFDNLPQGIYSTNQSYAELPSQLQTLLNDFSVALRELPDTAIDGNIQGILMIEDWQADLKRITLRIHRQAGPNLNTPTSLEKQLYLHRKQPRISPTETSSHER
ncbi:cytochrome b [Desulfopila aestuarii]|uniref:Cytochrome b subunit of the bc complex n=1 Tax=Desulfopila aestuarii DSM 18488 TaxID=1121416 RepID=A0A1M7Y9H9_9BACT|nr:cytochrome b N-terminal domain-containing protein [Desulfopila aestuarii]SHO49295.1 Cytochrome b subunit of the bc complex [Desulfopila aestuarii DSM 18488]